jgi:hypothetical protein
MRVTDAVQDSSNGPSNDSNEGTASGQQQGLEKDGTGCPALSGSRDSLAHSAGLGGVLRPCDHSASRTAICQQNNVLLAGCPRSSRTGQEAAGQDEGWEYITEADLLEYCLSS